MYKVISAFKDKGGKIYEVGDEYKSLNKERIETLSTNNNKYGYPFIELVKVEQAKKGRPKKVETE